MQFAKDVVPLLLQPEELVTSSVTSAVSHFDSRVCDDSFLCTGIKVVVAT